MRVSMSAIGSLTTPMELTAITNSTSSRRGSGPRPPESGSRFGTCRTSSCKPGAARRRGSDCETGPGTWVLASSARLLTSWPNYLPTLLAERHTQPSQQRAGFFVRGCGCHDRDLEASNLVDLVVVDLREDDLFAHSQRVVAAPVESLRADPSEVADSRQRDLDQLLQEVPHAPAAQGGLDPDRHPGAEFEGGHRLPGLHHYRLLAGDHADVAHRRLERSRVVLGFADADVDHDLRDPRHLHHVLVGELLDQGRRHRLIEKLADEGAPVHSSAHWPSVLRTRSYGSPHLAH